MFRNYLTIAIRNLLRQKIYSIINVSGLAIGLACCILAMVVIRHELGYDRFHNNADRIYRVLRERTSNNQKQVRWLTSGALARALEAEIPEVRLASKSRIYRVLMRYGNRVFEQRQGQIDGNFFKVFNFPFLKGDPETALSQPYSAVITQEAAARFFGDGDPIGRVLTIEERYYGGDYKITGVLKDVPANSSLQFDLLHATDGRTEAARLDWTSWQGRVQQAGIQTFVLLDRNAGAEALERKLSDLIERHMGADVRKNLTYRLQPLLRWHLYSRADYGLAGGGDIGSLYIFAAVALLILSIACINFINLTTARSAGRAREVGMRKVFGAHRGHLVGQFLGESVLLSLLALLLALALAHPAVPRLNDLAQTRFALTAETLVALLPGLLAVGLIVGLAAGLYPAVYLSAFDPAGVLQGSTRRGSGGAWLRKTLVVFQFAISVLLLIATGVVDRQLAYISNKKLGFDKEHVVVLPIFLLDRESKTRNDPWLVARYNVVKQAFLEHPNVLSATAFRFLPGQGGGFVRIVKPEGHEGTEWRMPVQEADESFFEALGVQLLAGRTFSPLIERDRTHAYVLNETAVRALGWTVEDAVGRRFGRARSEDDARGTVIGVVKDFHYASLREEIEPAAIAYRQWFYNYLALRIRGGDVPGTIAFLERTWKAFMAPDQPFVFSFLDEEIDAVYQAEKRFGRIVGAFSVLAVFLACLGLFGLAAFTAEQRTREFGIRKVLGASVSSIVFLLSKDFVKLVVLANLIAWPVAYYVMDRWLQGFAYRIDLGIGIFLLGGALALAIALLTVGYQAFKAATTNPVDTLRYE